MYQESCLKHNYEREYNIFDKQFALHNINYDKIKEFMFLFLLNDFCSNILCWCFCQSNWN